MTTLIRFIPDEAGATAIEYGSIAPLISVAAIAAMQSLGTTLSSLFGNISTNLR
jgi:pilus assembly protein Flp/PilA